MEALTNAFYPISTRIYQEAQAANAGNGAGTAGPDMGAGNAGAQDGAFEADYEVVDDDNNN